MPFWFVLVAAGVLPIVPDLVPVAGGLVPGLPDFVFVSVAGLPDSVFVRTHLARWAACRAW